MEFKKLNNGIEMPKLGLGVFQITDLALCEEIVSQAITMGYRLIDTATAYENEEAVGRGIKNANIPREELFISSKLWINDMTYEGAKRGFNRSLEKLGLNYIDLYSIHQPYNDYYGAWRALVELYNEGKIRALGVDNFKQDRLADFLEYAPFKPQVNLLEVHPFYQRQDEIQFLDEEDIALVAWSPFASGQFHLLEDNTLQEISKNHTKSVGQIILRWLMQLSAITIPKTSTINRLKENFDIFDFILSPEEMQLISLLNQNLAIEPKRETAKDVRSFFDAYRHIHA